jgi:hypothetical protein
MLKGPNLMACMARCKQNIYTANTPLHVGKFKAETLP